MMTHWTDYNLQIFSQVFINYRNDQGQASFVCLGIISKLIWRLVVSAVLTAATRDFLGHSLSDVCLCVWETGVS